MLVSGPAGKWMLVSGPRRTMDCKMDVGFSLAVQHGCKIAVGIHASPQNGCRMATSGKSPMEGWSPDDLFRALGGRIC